MMERIRNISIIFMSLIISCCSAQKQPQGQNILQDDNILGKYVKDDFPYINPNSEEIILLSNNIVNYNLSLEVYRTHSIKGFWELIGDTLKLSFEIPPEKIDGGIDIIYEKDKQSIVDLTIVDSNDNSLGGYSIFINGKESFIYSKHMKIEPQFIDKIKIDTSEEIYKKEINKYIDTNIKIILTPDKWRNAIYDFLKTDWLVRGHKLIFIKNNLVNEKYFLIKSR
jgi:hypothetical protein